MEAMWEPRRKNNGRNGRRVRHAWPPRRAQRPIRELLPTSPAAVALGHHASVRDALELMRRKAQLCAGRGSTASWLGWSPSAMCHQSSRHAPDVDRVPLQEVMQPDPESCIWTMRSCMPSTRCSAVPTACPCGGRAAAPHRPGVDAGDPRQAVVASRRGLGSAVVPGACHRPHARSAYGGAPRGAGDRCGRSASSPQGADCAFLLPAAPLTRAPTYRFGCLRPVPALGSRTSGLRRMFRTSRELSE